jgi:RNA 2',3'-cyclic 3'-phosphodiesterase
MRLFVAVNLPAEVREAVAMAARPLVTAAPALAWVPPDQLHLTIKFLGECADDAQPALADALDGVAERHRDFALDLRDVGAFPNFRRPRVVWMGVEHAARLELLQHDVERACEALGHEVEGRPFRPHLTLARVRAPLPPTSAQSLARAARAVRFHHEVSVTSIDLMRSTPAAGGSRYDLLHAAPLRAAAEG